MKYIVVLIIMALIVFSCKRKDPDWEWEGKAVTVASHLGKVAKVTCAPETIADGCTGISIIFCQVYFKDKKGIATFKCTRENKCRLITWVK